MKIRLLLCLVVSAIPASASVLMLDFGPTVAVGDSLANSPHHAVNPSFAENTLNTIGTTGPVVEVTSGLIYADGTAASGMGVNMGSVQYGNIAADPSSAPEDRGFLNAIQIVQIPEPSLAALFTLTFAPVALRRRR